MNHERPTTIDPNWEAKRAGWNISFFVDGKPEAMVVQDEEGYVTLEGERIELGMTYKLGIWKEFEGDI